MSNSSKICFVILHYLALQDTIECVESIERQKYDSVSIIIVDNGSPNGSGKVLKEKYSGMKNIYVLLSKENLGFARGNNLGFRFAKKELGADFIVLINNDTLLEQASFSEILKEKYERYQYSVLGPDIVTRDGFHQNPYFRNGITLKECRRIRRNQYIHLLLNQIGLDAILDRQITHDEKATVSGDVMDVSLHGACLIFSPLYISRFDGLDPRTFLYFEEDILKLYSRKYHFLMMYSGDLQIFHKEDVSSRMASKTNKEKRNRQYRERIKSAKVYETIWKEFERTEG